MSLTNAILLGLLYWYCNIEAGYSFYWNFGDPLCTAIIVGLLLGNVSAAMKFAASIQPVYLGLVGAGGHAAADKYAGGIIAVSAAVVSGLSVELATALAVPVGLIMAQLHTIHRIVAATWVHIADKAAEKGNVKAIYRAGLLYTNLFKLVLLGLPMTLILYFGADSVANLVDALPKWIINGLEVVGGMLPALGFGMTILVIGRKILIPYALAGFFLVKYSGLAIMPLTLIGVLLGFMHIMFSYRLGSGEVKDSDAIEVNPIIQQSKLLSMKDVHKMYLFWWYACEQSNSFERLQSLAFCIAFSPALKKLYGYNEQEYKKALKRHLLFFNTQGTIGALVHGITLAMEEQRAMGNPIEEQMIVDIKTSLMGPFAGIGDTLDAIVGPLVIVMFLPYAAQGYWWAGLGHVVILCVLWYLVGWYLCRLGYTSGSKAAMSVLSSGTLKICMTFACVLGMFMMGALSANFVNVQTPLTIQSINGPISVQKNILDAIIPGIPTALTVAGVYVYLSKRGSMMKCCLFMVAIGLVLGCLGILGTPAV